MSQKPMQCLECKIGTLFECKTVVTHTSVIADERLPKDTLWLADWKTNSRELKPVKEDTYIACTNCDFMGSAEDVLALMENKPKPGPRYIAYEILPMPGLDGKQEFHVSGIMPDPNSGSLPAGIYEVICPFKNEEKARNFIYRISGISGIPGQQYYLVETK